MWEGYTFRGIYWKELWLKKEKEIGYVAEGSAAVVGNPVKKEGKIPRAFCDGSECETTVSACLIRMRRVSANFESNTPCFCKLWIKYAVFL
jgi:hypothetical protein